jgi:hypothetical protein
VPLRSSKITLDLQEEFQENLVQNETIPTVERSNFKRDFGNTAAFQLTLHMEQTSTILSRTYVLETRVDAASKDGDGLVWEVGQEELRFKALNFTMLDGEGSKEVIKFNRLVSSSSSFVSGSLQSEPKMNIPRKNILHLLGAENNVAVSLVKLAILILRPRNYLKLFDPPNLKTTERL